MRLLRASAAMAVVVAPVLLASARAQDDPAKKDRPENQVFKEAIQDENKEYVDEIRFKDVSYKVSQDPETRKKVSRVALFLDPNQPVIVTLSREGVIVDIKKGQLANALDVVSPEIRAAIKLTEPEHEVQILAAREFTGRVKKILDDAIELLPATRIVKPGDPGKNVYDKNGAKITIPFKDIKRFVNLTLQAQQQQNPGNNPQLANDVVSRMDLRVGDTVKIGFVYGQIDKVTETQLVLHEWKGNSWGDDKTYDRDKLGDVISAALELRRSYPVNGSGEVVVKEEKQRIGKSNLLMMRGSVWHDQKDYILVGASLVFAAGPAGTNFEQTPAFKEEVPIPPVFGDEPWKKERPIEQDDGQVTIFFDPAKNLIPAKSADALPHIIAALAAVDRDPSSMPRVYATAALNGHPDLLMLLVVRHANVPAGPDQEKQQGLILDALQQFGEKGSKALVDSLRVPDGAFTIPVAREDGTIARKEQKDQAAFWKKYALKILASMPGAAAAERGRHLFDLYEERTTELGDSVMKVFQARVSESIDSLLDVAVSSGGRPTNDELKRADDAALIIKSLGEPGFNELLARIRASGQQGFVVAKQLEVKLKKQQDPLPDLIGQAIGQLVDAKRAERRAVLTRTLEDAKAKIGSKDWEGALAVVEDVLAKDRDMDEAKKLLYDCLVHVADTRLAQKKRGEAATLLRRVLDAGQKTPGAQGMLARILCDAAREDLDALCVRREPDVASEVVKRCTEGEVLKIDSTVKNSTDNWYPIKLNDKGDRGWVCRLIAGASGDGLTCTMHDKLEDRTTLIRGTLDQVRQLSAERTADANVIDGQLWIRDAREKADAGLYQRAYASFQKARELVPNDPALKDAWKCWVFANAFLLLIFAGVVVVAAVAFVVILKTRQKRVKVAEFKYYGKDRVRVEREIDGASTAGAAADGAAPADQPSDAAPPT